MLLSRSNRNPRISLIWILPLLLLFHGCAFQGATVLEDRATRIGSIAVAGFIPVLSGGEEPGVVRGPLQGTAYLAHPVPQDVAEKMTESVYSRLSEMGYDLVSPGQAKGVLAKLLSSEPNSEGIQLYMDVGKALSTEGVLVGYVYRWWEREGTDFAVQRPASVAFDLYLLRSEDGAVVWRGKFDKTQQSFVENLLDIGTFMKSRGRWVKAETLAEMGLSELLDKFPRSIDKTEKE
jgi:hypothetical protein